MSRESDRDQQLQQIYASIGHFVVAFSRLVDSMEHAVRFAMIGINQGITQAVLAGLTADPLISVWRSVLIAAYGKQDAKTGRAKLAPSDEKLLKILCAEAGDLN
jgi:hypothetical protein